MNRQSLELIFTSARQKSGKTELILELANHMAKDKALNVFVNDADDSARETAQVKHYIRADDSGSSSFLFNSDEYQVRYIEPENYDYIITDTNGGTNIKDIAKLTQRENAVAVCVIGLDNQEEDVNHLKRLSLVTDCIGIVSASSVNDSNALNELLTEARRWRADVLPVAFGYHPVLSELHKRGLGAGQLKRGHENEQNALQMNIAAIWETLKEQVGG